VYLMRPQIAAEFGSAGVAGHAQSVPPDVPRLLNRELSWLQFNQRVLHEALDARTPLLERIGFLSIFTSNLDEFFMKRVGALRRQVATGVSSRSLDGMTAAEQLVAIRKAVLPLLAEQARGYRQEILPALREHNVQLLGWDELTDAERAAAPAYFRANVFPVLTPLAVDPGHPFPFISNLSQSLGVTLRPPDREELLFARVKVPEVLGRWLPLKAVLADQPAGQFRYVRLIDLIRQNLDQLFPGMTVVRVMPFRVTRNADVEREEEDAEDLLEMIEEELRARRLAGVVRLEHGPEPDPWMLRFLMDELELTEQEVYELPAELDYTDLRPLLDLPLPALKYEPWTPVIPPALADEETDIFGVIRAGDLLVHHPYESFNASVERFIAAAVEDPRVLAIKMTLYRTGDDSPFIPMLIQAAESGKQVVCIVEVKARFDEQRNIRVAQRLEKAGVHVVYGIVGLKTHNKTTLVVRREPEGLRCYTHIGTGNYHVGTARVYTDLGLFTAKSALTEDVAELFNNLTGRSLSRNYRKLLIAPTLMKNTFLEMIGREIQHRTHGRPAHIIAKLNSLEDAQIIAALYDASAAGVPIDLIVRGFCCLRPGVPGLSENIRVISVIGRFLEHSRLIHFRNGAAEPVDGEFYIGSADWMGRNLHHRVEVVAPIEDHPLRERCWSLLTTLLHDQRQAWDMRPDGGYTQRQPADADADVGTHRTLMRQVMQQRRGDLPGPPSPT
jgi:polyphosphate kinase